MESGLRLRFLLEEDCSLGGGLRAVLQACWWPSPPLRSSALTRIQLLAVDVDGTLVTSEDEISVATRAALHRVREAGVEVVIATGRRYRNTQGAIGALGLPVPSVCLGGALVKGGDGRTLHADVFEAEEFRAVASLFRDRGHAVLAQRDSHQDGGYSMRRCEQKEPATASPPPALSV